MINENWKSTKFWFGIAELIVCTFLAFKKIDAGIIGIIAGLYALYCGGNILQKRIEAE